MDINLTLWQRKVRELRALCVQSIGSDDQKLATALAEKKAQYKSFYAQFCGEETPRSLGSAPCYLCFTEVGGYGGRKEWTDSTIGLATNIELTACPTHQPELEPTMTQEFKELGVEIDDYTTSRTNLSVSYENKTTTMSIPRYFPKIVRLTRDGNTWILLEETSLHPSYGYKIFTKRWVDLRGNPKLVFS